MIRRLERGCGSTLPGLRIPTSEVSEGPSDAARFDALSPESESRERDRGRLREEGFSEVSGRGFMAKMEIEKKVVKRDGNSRKGGNPLFMGSKEGSKEPGGPAVQLKTEWDSALTRSSQIVTRVFLRSSSFHHHLRFSRILVPLSSITCSTRKVSLESETSH